MPAAARPAKGDRMLLKDLLRTMAEAETVFDLRPCAMVRGRQVAHLVSWVDASRLDGTGIGAARANLTSLCGRELGRLAASQAREFVDFALAARSPVPARPSAPARSSGADTVRGVFDDFESALERGARDSLPAWRLMGLLYKLDIAVAQVLGEADMQPYRTCRSLLMLHLQPRPTARDLRSIHLEGLLAFIDLFEVFHLDFGGLLRLLDRHGGLPVGLGRCQALAV